VILSKLVAGTLVCPLVACFQIVFPNGTFATQISQFPAKKGANFINWLLFCLFASRPPDTFQLSSRSEFGAQLGRAIALKLPRAKDAAPAPRSVLAVCAQELRVQNGHWADSVWR